MAGQKLLSLPLLVRLAAHVTNCNSSAYAITELLPKIYKFQKDFISFLKEVVYNEKAEQKYSIQAEAR